MKGKVKSRKKGVIVWGSVGGTLAVILLVATILCFTALEQLLFSLIGRPQAVSSASENVAFESDFDSKEEALAAANELNERVNEEGIVLLKNENGALPLKSGAKVNVFGKSSVNLVYGGSGSGAGSTDGRKNLFESLDAVGIRYNTTLKSFYENSSASGEGRPANPPIENSGVYLPTGETPVESYGTSVWNSCADEEIDTALVVFSRINGEGFDLPRTMKNKNGNGAVEGANADDHYLQLDNNERALLKRIGELDNIEHIIVLINSNSAMELGFLDDAGHYAYNDKIDAALWIGGPGNSGIMALGRVLTGEVTPSGRLPDTYARDFTKDPSFVNFGNNNVNERKGKYTISGDQYMKTASQPYPYYFVDYEEGIYVGYRYWETRGYTEGAEAYTGEIKGSTTKEWQDWYSAHVVYPFGYGLSYTTFEWSVTNRENIEKCDLKDGKFTIEVEVTNTGDYAGKDVVEIYAVTPYYEYGIEKAHKVLCGFAKTPILYPSSQSEKGPSSCTIEIEIDPYDIASYDYSDANANGFKGYELEKGDYIFCVSKNAHESVEDLTVNLSEDVRYEKDAVTGYKVENRFDGIDAQLSDVSVNGNTRKGMSRTDWEGTYPTSRAAAEDRIVDEAFIEEFKKTDSLNPHIDEYKMPDQAAKAPALAPIQLIDMMGEDYDSEKWDDFMDQITVSDMVRMIENGNFQSPDILYVGKAATYESDGPVGFVNFMDLTGAYYGTCSYASETVMASTWNLELLYEVGVSIGNEGIWGNAKGDQMPYSGLYAPGANIHRSPFGGRNYEYFSEDGYLSGMLAASEISGAAEKGVYMYIKHFAVNDQETHRDQNGIAVWLTEQALREIYFKPFEKAVKIGKTTAVMSSFNRIGSVWAGGNYNLLTEVLRNEWGFRGTVICDFNLSTYMNAEQMHYAGGDLNLTTMPNNRWSPDTSDPADVYVVRQSAKNVMYTVANSCVMNRAVSGYTLPLWQIALIVLDCVAFVAIGVWGFFAIRKYVKGRRETAEAGASTETEKFDETGNLPKT